MSVSFFPTVPYPDKIGVNMTYSSFGEVRQIVAAHRQEFADLIKEAYGERLPSDFYTRYDKCCDRLKGVAGEALLRVFQQERLRRRDEQGCLQGLPRSDEGQRP